MHSQYQTEGEERGERRRGKRRRGKRRRGKRRRGKRWWEGGVAREKDGGWKREREQRVRLTVGQSAGQV